MGTALLVAGAFLVAAALVDSVVTTLSLFAGASTLSGWLGRLLWRGMNSLHTRRRGSGRLLQWSGVTILTSTFCLWVAMLWAGWFCILSAEESAVTVSRTGRPADAASRLYFAGYTVFTFGNGDYAPRATWAELCSAVASLSGLFLVTLSITYFLQVVQAVVHKRHFAQHVHALGADGATLISRGWTGEQFTSMFNQHLVSLTAPLLHMGEQHLAYPAAHYFRSPTLTKSPAHAVAVLDDALLLLTAGVQPAHRPDPAAIGPLSEAVRQVLATLGPEFFPRPGPPRPAPDVAHLRRQGIPAVEGADYADAVRCQSRRRAAVHGYLHSDGRTCETNGSLPER